MNVQFPSILRPILGSNLLWRIKPSSKVIYLTFDDGPVPEVTPQILDILDKYGWKATFFCVGQNVEKYPDIYAEVVKRGHKTANHTYNHVRGFSLTTKEYVENVKKASGLIENKLFRPPHGQITFRQIDALKTDYRLVMWDVITHDYNQKLNPEKVLRNVKRYSRKGSIVVFHDSVKAKNNVLAVLPKAIEFWIAHNYEFGIF